MYRFRNCLKTCIDYSNSFSLCLASIVLQTYVIRESSTINAMSSFNSDVVGKVIEEQEEDTVIENMVREKILRKVKHAVGAEDITDVEILKVLS